MQCVRHDGEHRGQLVGGHTYHVHLRERSLLQVGYWESIDTQASLEDSHGKYFNID